jgi:hypothetical protein
VDGTRSFQPILVPLLVVLVLAVGCSHGEPAKSNTPRIRSTLKELEPGLITAAQVSEMLGLARVRRVPNKSAPIYENPDPRGPCGVPIKQPDLSLGATVVLAGRTFAVTDTIVELTEQRAQAFMDEFLADATPGCGPFRSMTNTGVAQLVKPTIIDLPVVGDQRAAINSAVTTEGQTAYAGEVLVRRGTRVGFAILVTGSPIPDDVVREFAVQVDRGLARLRPRAAV